MYSILLILHTALENKTWPAGTVGMTFAKVESVVHRSLVCNYGRQEIIEVKVFRQECTIEKTIQRLCVNIQLSGMKSNTSEKEPSPTSYTPRTKKSIYKWRSANKDKYNKTCCRAMVKYYINNKDIVSERKKAWYQRRKESRATGSI